jgi:3-oxoacyl-[acyl-carrier-protein] synthase II
VNGAERRVAITGLGVKSPAGSTVKEAFDQVLSGNSAARLVDELAGHGRHTTIACPVHGFVPEDYFDRREARGMDRSAQLGLAAAADAMDDSGLEAPHGSQRWGVIVGTGGVGTVSATVETAVAQLQDAPGKISAYTAAMLMPSSTAARISMRFGLNGPALTLAAACASGTVALGEGMRLIREGVLDVVIAGGTEAPLTSMVMEGFHKAGALTRRMDDPSSASRPFDVDRDGFVLGEGAAFLILERWDLAQARGAHIHAELAGYGNNSDAHHIVAPVEDGSLAAACMADAMATARVSPADVGHINAHGTSTVRNDRAEARAILRCFGGEAPAITAPKGVVGHMMGAAGAFEAVITVMSLATGLIPPVANHVGQDGDALLDVVAGEPRRVAPAAALSNSFGFGGHNASLVLRPA